MVLAVWICGIGENESEHYIVMKLDVIILGNWCWGLLRTLSLQVIYSTEQKRQILLNKKTTLQYYVILEDLTEVMDVINQSVENFIFSSYLSP